MIPPQMIAISVAGGKGPAAALTPQRVATPTPTTGEILIRVRAAGLNRSDILQREGYYVPPAGAPTVLGLEVAGEVAALGRGVTRWQVGDRVAALLGGGGYAEYAAVDARHVLPIPTDMDFVHAAGLPETVITIFANAFEHGALKAGETLLLHGATSGVGVSGIQMAKAAGARVIATSRGAEKAARALELGADRSVDVTHEDFVLVAKSEGGVDVALDMVGGSYPQRDLETLKPGGRLVMIATQAGPIAELNLMMVMMKRALVTGSTLRSRPADEKARLTAAVEREAWPWVFDGRVKSIVERTFALADAAAAHAFMERGSHVGKLILTV
jgi:putative PIG3 family NAD(P)H quinone oxidoreductase